MPRWIWEGWSFVFDDFENRDIWSLGVAGAAGEWAWLISLTIASRRRIVVAGARNILNGDESLMGSRGRYAEGGDLSGYLPYGKIRWRLQSIDEAAKPPLLDWYLDKVLLLRAVPALSCSDGRTSSTHPHARYLYSIKRSLSLSRLSINSSLLGLLHGGADLASPRSASPETPSRISFPDQGKWTRPSSTSLSPYSLSSVVSVRARHRATPSKAPQAKWARVPRRRIRGTPSHAVPPPVYWSLYILVSPRGIDLGPLRPRNPGMRREEDLVRLLALHPRGHASDTSRPRSIGLQSSGQNWGWYCSLSTARALHLPAQRLWQRRWWWQLSSVHSQSVTLTRRSTCDTARDRVLPPACAPHLPRPSARQP